MTKVYFETLGCSKNDIDTENMISLLQQASIKVVDSPNLADIVVINTCSFILDAKTQSIDTIFSMVQQKDATHQKLIVAGCLAQRYPEEILQEIPEVDAVIGTGQISEIVSICNRVQTGERFCATEGIHAPYCEHAPRIFFPVTQYVKISEGCNNHCTYCIIPKLRGKMRSRPIESIFAEVQALVAGGTKEVILIAQNTTDYGMDLYHKRSLSELLKTLDNIEGLEWIRVLYMYPEGFTDELIDVFAHAKSIVPYFDMPLQHISDPVLKAMGRRSNRQSIQHLMKKLRADIPGSILRTTFIVGFHNEQVEDFNRLNNFIAEYQFDKMGVFSYSLEEGTPAYKFSSPVSEETKRSRKDVLMTTQQKISAARLRTYVGKVFRTLIESVDDDHCTYWGRTYMDAPGIDGKVRIESKTPLIIGEFYDIMMIGSSEYDLIGEKVMP